MTSTAPKQCENRLELQDFMLQTIIVEEEMMHATLASEASANLRNEKRGNSPESWEKDPAGATVSVPLAESARQPGRAQQVPPRCRLRLASAQEGNSDRPCRSWRQTRTAWCGLQGTPQTLQEC